MECKNCQDPLEENAQFCDNCGAKVIKNRITLKLLILDLFTNVFGIDSKFFLTLKKMFISPNEVIEDYLYGIRKRYINPFAFLTIGAGLSLIVFNYYADEYKMMQGSFNPEQLNEMKKVAEQDLSTLKNISEKELSKLKQEQESAKNFLNFLEVYINFILHNFNLVAFLFLPFYALISKFTYWKPHNYGEHIVINAYLQGTTMYFSLIAFILAMFTNNMVFSMSVFLFMIYYLFTFSKLYKHSIWKAILKLLRFFLVLAVSFILIIVLGIIFMLVKKFIGF